MQSNHRKMRRAATLVLAALIAAPFAGPWPRAAAALGLTHAAQTSKSARIEGPFFSDDGGIAARVIEAINSARHTLDIAMYDLTEPAIARALVAARRRGVRIRIVADAGQAGGVYSKIAYLRSQGVGVRLGQGFNGERSLMHDKFAVFDGQRAETGSFNWTTSGERYNSENAVFISDSTVAARFEKEFENLWRRARSQ